MQKDKQVMEYFDIFQEEEKTLYKFGQLCFCPVQNKVDQIYKSSVVKGICFIPGTGIEGKVVEICCSNF